MFRLLVIGLLVFSSSMAYAWPSNYESRSRARLAIRPRLFARVERPERLRVEKVQRVEKVIREEFVQEHCPAPIVEERIRERIVQPEIRKEIIVQPEIREEIREKVIIPQQKQKIIQRIERVEECPDCPQELRLRTKLRHH